MRFPAARLTDLHTCPMCAGVPAPIVWKCAWTVLTGKLPQARVTDMCVCLGPPPPAGGDPIVTGAWNVLVEGLPAARLTDLTGKGGAIITGLPTVLIGMQGGGAVSGGAPAPAPATGLGAGVDGLVAKSPTLSDKIDRLQKDGWEIVPREGGGSECDKTNKKIYIDTKNKSGADQTRSLAHEAGHADYTADPYVPMAGKTKQEYVDANVKTQLKDEGEATLTNIEVREEIKANGGPDIGLSGNSANHPKYESAYEDYTKSGDRDKAREEIGGIFADGEKTSTTGESYRDYYADTYEKHYDKHNP